jgi:hypothetical protein
MTDDDRADARLADLERRVSVLEGAARRPTPAPEAPTPGSATAPSDTFWALDGLRARVPDPGAVLLTGHVTLADGRRAEWQEAATAPDLLEPDWAGTADALAALGQPVRLRLLQRVLGGAATVPELLATDGVGTSGQVYHHLRQLVAAGWLRALGGGRYEVPVARVVPLLAVVLGGRR